MPFVLLVPLIIAGFVLAAFAGIRRVGRIQAAWSAAARQLSVTHSGSGWTTPQLNGSIGGLLTRVDVYSTGGKNKTYYTRYRANFPTKGTAVRLKRQTGLSRVTKFFGAQDVEIGDVAFDDAFVVKAGSEARAAQYLTLPRRTLLLKLYSLYRGIDLTPDYFEIVTRGYEDDATTLITNTRRLVSAGRVLAGLRDNDERVERSLRSRAQGDMGAATEELRQLDPHPDPDDVDTPLLEAELLASSGQLTEAEPLLAKLSAQLPTDEEVAGLQRAMERMEPTAPAPDPSPVAMQEIVDDLFVSNRLSFETAEIFDEAYLGREITWSGKVKSIRDYRSDLDFGPGPGSKAVIAIAEVEHDLYGVSEIDAVVHLPSGTAARLDRGDPVTFSGRLLKADSMMRNIYVRDGRLS
ncbi:tetratricopeptide repeat protein [Actinomycetota bacterium]